MELGKLTLEDLEALAERLGKAAQTIRDAQSLLGGPQPWPDRGPARAAPPSMLTPAELAQREQLLAVNRAIDDDMPPDIKAAIGGVRR